MKITTFILNVSFNKNFVVLDFINSVISNVFNFSEYFSVLSKPESFV